ncbi:MAG TPA: tRNA pseudouridine(13) synthase TruD [Anaerovoracaceae bacterium]|nr:tRNA pseudouridine(13) synthase TruD [Anaerovoracaceae bacterium]
MNDRRSEASCISKLSPKYGTMKYRRIPQDFVVDEISDLNLIIEDSGDYKIYIIKKTDIETFKAISIISKNHNIDKRAIGFAGIKDAHAVTTQYITIPKKYSLDNLPSYIEAKHIGFCKSPIKIGDLIGNRFTITVRDITKGELDGIYQRAKDIETVGVPNYFDSQRFGSVFGSQFMVKNIMRGDFESACKIFLTEFTKHEKSIIKKDKQLILQHWGWFENLSIQDKKLRDIIKEYNKTNDWQKTYHKIPGSLRELYVSAYQSYLWNECVKLLLKNNIEKECLYTVAYNIGNLIFYTNGVNIEQSFQTISHDIKPKPHEVEIIDYILEKEGLQLNDFYLGCKTDNYFKVMERKTVIYPKNFQVSKEVSDDLNKGRFKITVKFELEKGSYATIVLKRLFNQ